MNPKPLASLNHFTVPCAISLTFFLPSVATRFLPSIYPDSPHSSRGFRGPSPDPSRPFLAGVWGLPNRGKQWENYTHDGTICRAQPATYPPARQFLSL